METSNKKVYRMTLVLHVFFRVVILIISFLFRQQRQS
jgi:preprotein translocase subunit SecG